MPKKWANTHLCTSKVTPRGAFWKISVARKRGKPPPPFFEVANFRQNGMTSHFAETPPRLVASSPSIMDELACYRVQFGYHLPAFTFLNFWRVVPSSLIPEEIEAHMCACTCVCVCTCVPIGVAGESADCQKVPSFAKDAIV